ncbi:AlbA family DNA-binding domain-containing protein [Flavobacterium soli]|uniref:AlbA family DNA-binding domain-containing protein n=1 Tax=Flavobacterium soli TaxID=344881 RepID=UPI0003FC0810|nr:ATP-binding protein [Flavobacterium soli]
MNFSETYFAKNLEDLIITDITNYFATAKEESTKIEFKAFHAQFGNFNKNLEGVIRGLCAFLNSEGGILIWGAPLGVKNGDQILFQGALSLVDQLLDKDMLISKISDSIAPLPIGINVKIIEDNGSYLYVFEIQRSNYSPHQYKNTYWARLDGQTKPAPHYLIEALFKKISYPNIEAYINLDRFGNYPDGRNFLDISILTFNFSELQNEYDITYRVISSAIFEGATSANPNIRRHYDMAGHQFKNDAIRILHFGAPDITSQKLLFNIGDLPNGEMDLVLHFGGKQSPLKFSEYKLNFNIQGIPAENPLALITSKKENTLASDKQKELGTTRENLLKDLLKR